MGESALGLEGGLCSRFLLSTTHGFIYRIKNSVESSTLLEGHSVKHSCFLGLLLTVIVNGRYNLFLSRLVPSGLDN